MSAVKILVAYDHPVLSTGLRHLSRDHAAIQLVGAIDQGRDLAGMVRGLRPDLLLLGLDTTGFDPTPISAAIRLDERESGLRVAMLMIADNADLLNGSASQGPLEATDFGSMRVSLQSKSRASIDLTPREHQVLSLIGKGCDNAEIAWILSISKRTVETYVHRIYTKLGLKGRSHAVRYAVENGLINDWD